MRDYIVAGWFTPDYRPWLDTLIPSLEAVGAPSDFVEVPKRSGGWEANTMSKPFQVWRAMNKHPGTTIIFIDVDCVVNKPLAPLADIRGDVGLYLRTKYRKNGSTRSGWRSGTLVLRPTSHAREFVQAWIKESDCASRYSVDQDSLAVALGRVPGLSVTTLGVSWCATVGDNITDPAIFHDNASRRTKTSRLQRLVGAIRNGLRDRRVP